MENQRFRVLTNAQLLKDENIVFCDAKGIKYLPIFEFIKTNLFENRTILIVEFVKKLSESSINLCQPEKIQHKIFSLGNTKSISLKVVDIEYNSLQSKKKYQDLHLFYFKSTPRIAQNLGDNDKKRDISHYSELLFIYMIFSEEKDLDLSLQTNKYVYESYNQLGFVITNETLFNQYICKELGHGNHDLLNQFTTTELATQMFKEGIMALCWGITPWPYVITSCVSRQERFTFPPFNILPVCTGEYIFRENISDISIIPGIELINWNTSLYNKNWPKLNLEGSGNIIELSLRIVKAVDNMGNKIPIPFFNIEKKYKDLPESQPILNFDIFR